MKTELKNISPTTMEMAVQLPWDEISAEYTSFAKKFARDIQLPGFRKGKAPMSRIEKMYQGRIEYDFINEKFYTFYHKAVLETKAQPVSEPSVTHYDFKKGEFMEFTVQYDYIPEWEMPKLDRKIKVDKQKYVVTDTLLDAQLERIRSDHAEITPLEAWEPDASIVARLEELDDAGEVIPDRVTESFTIIPGVDPFTPEIMKSLEEMASGESRDIILKNESDGNKEVPLRITALSFERRVLPELNDDLAAQIDPEVVDLPALKELMRKEYEDNFERNSQELFRQDIITAVAKAAEHILIPDSLTESYLEDLRTENEKQRKTAIDAETYRKNNWEQAVDLLRWELVRNRLTDERNIEVSEEEISEHVETVLVKPDTQNRDMYLQYFNTPQARKDLRSKLLADKVFAAVEADITVNVVEKPVER